MNSMTYGVRAAVFVGLGLLMTASVLMFATSVFADDVQATVVDEVTTSQTVVSDAPAPVVEEQAPATEVVVVEESVPVVEEQAPAEETSSTTPPTAEEPVVEVVAEPVAEAPSQEVAPAPVEEPAGEVLGESVEVAAEEAAPVATPELSTEKADYHPGETATIFGNLFEALQTIVLKIFGSDDEGGNYVESSQTLTTDENGYFSTTYTLDDLYRPFYEITASTLDGSLLASSWFRDSAVGTYDQCSNDDGDGYATGDTGCRYANGNLNKNNSTYFEGDATVQRVWLKGYAPNESHTVTFHYGTTKSGKHAYDFLTSWAHSEDWITDADLCQDITGCTTAVVNTGPIPQDPNAGNHDNFARSFEMRGGTITNVSVPSIVSGSYVGDSETAITVSFTTDAADGDMCTTQGGGQNAITTCNVALFFGAHVSDSDDWTPELTAIDIPGSPYHVALAAEDGASIGQRDNQMQTDAIVLPSLGTLTLQKTVVTDNGGTAADTDWTLSASGPTPITGVDGASAVTAAPVLAGTYTLSESGGPAGYAAGSWVCTGGTQNGAEITLLAGESATCVITNDDQPATITVLKVVTNDNGGTAQPNDFNLTLEGNAVTSGVPVPVAPGTYTAGETLLPGYSFTGFTGDCDSNGDVTVALGESKTCTLTNNDVAPVLHLRKVVMNDNGGTATVANFTLTANGAGSNDISGTSPVDSGAGLDADTFALSESAVAGYTASGWVCVGGTQNGANITLGLGQEATCTITNDDIAPQLTVIKHVINDNGGSAVASDFTMNVTATNPSDASFPGAEAPGTTITLDAGAYSVDESAFAGYTKSLGANCSGAIAVGETKTCTITNDDQQAYIIVDKTVVNDNGGQSSANDFLLTVDGNAVSDGVAYAVNPGAHTAGETLLSGYTAGAWGTDCAANGSVTVALGETKTCTITNNDQPGTLTIVKNTVGGNDTFGFTVAGPTPSTPSILTVGNTGTTGAVAVSAGNYSISETTIPAGWDLTSATCTSGTPASLTVPNGGNVTCTFTNTQRGHIVIVKDVIGNPDPTDFTFQNNFGNDHPASFMLDEDANGTLPSSRSFEVLPGEYAVSEDAMAGWQQESATCDSGETVDSIDVAPGETVTCTFVNEELISITLIKNTVGGNGDFGFDATGAGLPADIDLTTVAGTATQTFSDLDQDNEYSISENVPAGWALASATCTGGNTPASITPEPGEDVTCTFTNNKPGAQIDVTPLTATNKIGDDHVITATVQTHNGNGTYGPAVDGTLVTFSLQNSNGATAAFVGGNTCVTAAGSCSVTINSPTTGNVAIHAAASPVVLGVAVAVETNGAGDNGADAAKQYVNARISITPLTDTNEVNDDHAFVVTVEKDLGAGFVPVAEGTVANAIVSPATTLDASDCNDGVDANGQCTVTVNSSVAGSFTITARSTVEVSGVEFKLQTNGLGGNSAPAVKTYVDASIALTPQEGTNNITDPHQITATVKKDEGLGLVAAVGETVTFSVTLGTAEFVGGVNTCVTDAAGTCSISIVDDTPGDNEVDASVSVTAGGLELARSTSGNAGPGGSDEAKKTYVAGALSITKAVTGLAGVVNGATVDDTFTVTVTGPSYPGGHQIVFTLIDGVLQNPNPVVLNNLIPGNYIITEADAGTEWTESVPANAVAVVASQTADATVTNTYVPGALEVAKVVQLNGYLFPQGVDTSFTLEVTGPSYPVAHSEVIDVVDGAPTNSPHTLQNLIPGAYTVTEVGADTVAWTVSGGGNVSVVSGGTAQKAVTNSLKIPNTDISITPNVFETEPGQNVILTIADTNNGAVPISSPSVELLANNVLTVPQPSYVSGDTNTNSKMDVGETWTWTVALMINGNTVFTVNGKGTDPLGNPVNGPTYAGETDSVTVRTIGTTRTIGFWQTHTNFTSSVFNLPAMQKYVGVNLAPVLGSHKGTITNVLGAAQSQLFGGFYAPIAKTTTGTKRTPVDQARIQMLQQLLAAKLNCAAFSCSGATQTLIANADAAYAAGSNKGTINALAGQLDAFNNSGDANAIPSGLPATGKATPKTSQSYANLVFWNQP